MYTHFSVYAGPPNFYVFGASYPPSRKQYPYSAVAQPSGATINKSNLNIWITILNKLRALNFNYVSGTIILVACFVVRPGRKRISLLW